MKINRENLNIGFKSFADEHNLELKIITRDETSAKSYGKYCVSWQGVTIIDGPMSVSCVGVGDTEEFAVKDYIKRISGKQIYVHSKNKKELFVPHGLYYDFDDGELN
jgi:hypothetical protein